MIVTSMTDEELLIEVSKDYGSCLSRVQKDYNFYRRTIVKSSKFPIYFKPIEYTSSRKNKFLLFIEAKSKKDSTNFLMTFVTYYLKPEGIYAIMIYPKSNYSKTIVIYPPHFFERYKERYLGRDIDTLDSIKEFFRYNSSNIIQFTEGNYYRGSCTHGFVFGEKLNENINILKTFITENMLKGDQNSLNTILSNELVELNNLKKKQKEFCFENLFRQVSLPTK